MEELVDRIAADLGVSQEARRKWRERGCVAYKWRIPILREAGSRGIALADDVFDRCGQKTDY